MPGGVLIATWSVQWNAMQSEALREAVTAAAGRTEVRDAVAAVYADLQSQIDARKPVCTASGRCCRFDEFGHRLYVTTMELAAFTHGLRGAGPSSGRNARPGDGLALPSGCPFQIDGLCSVHPIRPFGCRVFFCDATSTDWQNGQYERLHKELKRLHETLAVPYFYVEWRQALAALEIDADRPTQPKSSLSLRQLRL